MVGGGAQASKRAHLLSVMCESIQLLRGENIKSCEAASKLIPIKGFIMSDNNYLERE